MKVRYALTTAFVVALVAPLFVQSALAGDTPVVNGKPIAKGLVDAMLSTAEMRGQKASPEARKEINETLIGLELLVQAAQKSGVDKRADVANQILLLRHNTIANAYLADYVKAHPVSDAAIQKEYDEARKAAGDKEYKVRHILVDTEEQAKAVIEKLKKGEKFADLAKDSKDQGSKERGGELGWVLPSRLVPPFANAMVALKKGESTQTPVKSDFGFHVIELEDVRDLKLPPLESVKEKIVQDMQQRMVGEYVAQLRAAAKIQ